MLKRILVLCLAGISLLLLWFTVNNYRKAQPIADEILFGFAHSLHAAIEFSVHQDPTLHSLSMFHSHDIIYFGLADDQGIYKFHTNPKLIGTRIRDKEILREMSEETMTGQRIKLATGQDAYELITHAHVPHGTLGLLLVLQTHRADAVIRSARINMTVTLTLLVFSWFLTAVIYRYARREEKHRLDLAQQENLARMGEMGALLAHEIRNPLAGIKGFAQLIERRPDDSRTRDSAQRIIAETLRLEELTTDLLAFARRDEFPVTTIQVSGLIEQTVAMVRPEAEQSHIAIRVDYTQDLEFHGNYDRLTQVLLNLVRNGLQAMPDGGTLSISAVPAGSCISVMVTDSGHGISPDNMQRIFEPFFTTKARGTGLGLALCKIIIEEHNGTIGIESSTAGTTVTMILPRAWHKGKA
ncbi:MAG: ATP-binding protein [Geobacteraceae bacterium]|nr:ATP-binding protein [Geobacteraceae bacterium]